MKKLYVAANGDGVGEQIGNAILSDDHQALSGLSKKFKNAHSNIEKWVEKRGGEIVASAGDEIIFVIPEELASQLQGMKDAYSKHSGTTLTMGIGETISQASKALIYGKLNDKNQIVEYEPQIDDYISGEEEGDIPSPEDIDESASEESRTQEGVDQEDEEDQGQGSEDILSEDDDSSNDESSEDFSNQEDYSDEDEDEKGTKQIDVPEDELDGDYGSEDMEQGQPEHEKDMDEDEEFIHDAQENREDEADDDAIEADEEQNFFGEETDPSLEDSDEETDEEDSEDSDIPELSEDDLAFSDEDEDNQDLDGESDEDFDSEGDLDDEDSLEQDSSESDGDGFLNEMMHSNIDEGQEENVDSEENAEDINADQGFEDPENQQIKEKIFSALQSLKQNKEMLDQIQAQNPDLYQGIIANIQSMIEMGKKLGMETEQEEDMDESDLDQNIGTEPYGAYEKEASVKKPQGSFQA